MNCLNMNKMSNELCHSQLINYTTITYANNANNKSSSIQASEMTEQQQQLDLLLLALSNHLAYTASSSSRHLNAFDQMQFNQDHLANNDGNNNSLELSEQASSYFTLESSK